MKKGTKLVALLLGLALMVPACTPGTNPSKSAEPGTSSEAPVNYKVTISNKEELQAEWFVGDQSRKVNLEVEPKANITQLVNEGKIQITSSDPAKLAVEGQMASPVAAGEATITVKCGESEDSVKVTLQARQTNKEKFNIAHEGTAEDPLTNEEALVVAKQARDRFGSLVAMGIATMFAFYAIINLGMVMGLMPVTGLPLLLLSYGGSSMLSSMFAIGILISINIRRFY